jgi:hypothetical protein
MEYQIIIEPQGVRMSVTPFKRVRKGTK